MVSQLKDPTLAKTEDAMSKRVPPALQPALQKIMVAGRNMMYAPTHQGGTLANQVLAKPGDPLRNIAEGVVKLMLVMYKQSNKTMPLQAAIPATYMLLMEGLDYAESSGHIKVDSKAISAATKDCGALMLQAFNITPQMIKTVQQNPQMNPSMRKGSIIKGGA